MAAEEKAEEALKKGGETLKNATGTGVSWAYRGGKIAAIGLGVTTFIAVTAGGGSTALAAIPVGTDIGIGTLGDLAMEGAQEGIAGLSTAASWAAAQTSGATATVATATGGTTAAAGTVGSGTQIVGAGLPTATGTAAGALPASLTNSAAFNSALTTTAAPAASVTPASLAAPVSTPTGYGAPSLAPID